MGFGFEASIGIGVPLRIRIWGVNNAMGTKPNKGGNEANFMK